MLRPLHLPGRRRVSEHLTSARGVMEVMSASFYFGLPEQTCSFSFVHPLLPSSPVR